MGKKISPKKRDHYREALFKDAYGLDAYIWVTNYNDDKWNWDMCVLNFKDKAGKNYGLVEHFGKEDDNSTDYVLFEYENKYGFAKEKFDKFIDAELAMVDLMRKRKEGKD